MLALIAGTLFGGTKAMNLETYGIVQMMLSCLNSSDVCQHHVHSCKLFCRDLEEAPL